MAVCAVPPASSAAPTATLWAVGDGGVTGPADETLAARIEAEGPFDRLLYLGDVYETGTEQEFAANYETSFGRFKSLTSPTPGNHEWDNRATGYDPYWGSLAPQTNGGHYYSFDLAGWHIVSLNSEELDPGLGAAQTAWLRADLARYPGTCTIAFVHRPRYSASLHGDSSLIEPAWAELAGRAVALLSGHEHNYQRLTRERGVIQFVVGTGGRPWYGVNEFDSRLEASADTTFGALRLKLEVGRADFEFVTSTGARLDSGSMGCTPHDGSPPPPDETAPAAPSGLVAGGGDGSVALDWSTSPAADLDGYDVYRSTSQGGPYTQVNGARLSASAYTETGLSNGSTYYYVVKATDTAGNQSEASSEASATPAASTYSDAVTGTTGLLSYWRLGEQSGTTAADGQGNRRGTFRGGATLGRPGALAADADTAAGFDGQNDELTAGDSGVALTSTGTLEGWFYWEAGVVLMRDNSSPSTAGWILAYDKAGKVAYRVGNTTFTTTRTTASLKAGWHHLALTASNGSTALYIDGQLAHTGTGAGAAAAKMPWHVMRNGASAQFTRGRADEIAIYANALTPATITQHYTAGTGN